MKSIVSPTNIIRDSKLTIRQLPKVLSMQDQESATAMFRPKNAYNQQQRNPEEFNLAY